MTAADKADICREKDCLGRKYCHDKKWEEVIASPTAMEGLEQVRMQRLDIIVSDASMHHMDAYQLIRTVRNKKPMLLLFWLEHRLIDLNERLTLSSEYRIRCIILSVHLWT